MPNVIWATMSAVAPMGQQVAERAVQDTMRRQAAAEWHFTALQVGSLRSDADRRFPSRLYNRAPLPLALALGAICYPRAELTHRFDLRLPPALGREVVTVHDLPPLRFADEGELPASVAAGARRAELVICPSQFAADEVSELLGVPGERTRVIPNGVGTEFLSALPADDELLARRRIRPPFLLHAAGVTTRKNLPALAGAWRSVREEFPDLSLVLCGPPDERRDVVFGADPRAVRPGRLPPAELAQLMLRAAAVVVPSTYEGFGLPALEGMACGRPVVATATGALPEICGEAAVLVQPTAQGLAGGLDEVLRDPRRAEALGRAGRERARRFSWPAAAEQHLQAYRDVLGL